MTIKQIGAAVRKARGQRSISENYLPTHPDALRVIVGDNGSRTIVGARGYLRMRREALDEGQDIAPWAELERYPAE